MLRSPQKLTFSLLSISLLSSLFLHAKDVEPIIKIKNDFYLQYNDISGPSASSSTLTNGLTYNNLINFYTKGIYYDYKYNLNLGIKLTDDKRKDIKEFSIINLSGKVSKGNHTLELGDYIKSFSKYSLNSSLKGSAYTYDDQINKIDLIYGIAYPRWDSFWDNETDSLKREVFGARYNKNINEDLSLGIDVVKSNDSDTPISTMNLFETNLLTVNTTYKPIKGLKLYGEYSFSDNETNTSGVINNQKGSALFLQAIGNKNPSRVQLEYERVSPDFKTVTGSATPDREKFKAKWRYKIAKNTTLNSGFLWFKDNLDNTKTETTNTYRPDIGLTFKKLFNRRYSVLDLNYKLNYIDNGVSKTSDDMYDLNYKDRFGIIHSDTSLVYNIYDTKSNVRSQKDFKFNTTFNTRHSFKDLVLKPSLMLGTWNMNDELTNNGDNSYYQTSLGLGLDIPSKKLTTTLRLGKNKSTRDVGDNLDKFFASFDLYWKMGNYKAFKNVMLYSKTYINDYSYTTATNNYQEKSFTLGIKLTF